MYTPTAREGDEARELVMAVRREVAKLAEKWHCLKERASAQHTNATLAAKVGKNVFHFSENKNKKFFFRKIKNKFYGQNKVC